MNKKTKKLWSKAARLNLKLEDLLKKYGVSFVTKLLEYVLNEPHPKPYQGLLMIFPKKYRGRELDYDNYTEMLKDAGFKLRQWFEDFVDEDTGEIVPIERHNFRKLKPATKPKTFDGSMPEIARVIVFNGKFELLPR